MGGVSDGEGFAWRSALFTRRCDGCRLSDVASRHADDAESFCCSPSWRYFVVGRWLRARHDWPHASDITDDEFYRRCARLITGDSRA